MAVNYQPGQIDEAGYSLLETLIAMSLFLSVLIPLGSMIGTLMLDPGAGKLNTALELAQSEMNTAIASKSFADKIQPDTLGFRIIRETTVEGNLTRVSVSVALSKKPDKAILKLTKSVLAYP